MQITYHIKNIVRFAFVMISYPRAGVAYILQHIGRLVPFQYRVLRDGEALLQKKEYLRKNKKNVGHAFKDKKIRLSLAKFRLCEFVLPEGETLTAEHFFLNRPIEDVEYLLKITKPHIQIRPSSLIFDPGCGTGRHLFYLIDKYGCFGVGVDVYAPAIAIAEKAKFSDRAQFHNCSSLAPGMVEKVIPNGCEFVFINSWLNHVFQYEGYDAFIDKILGACSYLLLITSVKHELTELFTAPDVVVEESLGKTRYALIKGKGEMPA